MRHPIVGHRIPLDAFAGLLAPIAGLSGVYGLTDPLHGHLIAYVGQSGNLLRRYFQHLDPTADQGPGKLSWLERIRFQGLIPGLVILEVHEARGRKGSRDLLALESRWIVQCRAKGLAWINRGDDPPALAAGCLAMAEILEGVQRDNEAWQVYRDRVAADARRRIRLAAAREIAQAIFHERREGKDRVRKRAERIKRTVIEQTEREAAVRLQSVENRYRVRASNVARIGLKTFETPKVSRT